MQDQILMMQSVHWHLCLISIELLLFQSNSLLRLSSLCFLNRSNMCSASFMPISRRVRYLRSRFSNFLVMSPSFLRVAGSLRSVSDTPPARRLETECCRDFVADRDKIQD